MDKNTSNLEAYIFTTDAFNLIINFLLDIWIPSQIVDQPAESVGCGVVSSSEEQKRLSLDLILCQS